MPVAFHFSGIEWGIGVTYDDVFGAIARLEGESKALTVDNVRGVLGTGSKTTISRHWRNWRSQQKANSGLSDVPPGELANMVEGL